MKSRNLTSLHLPSLLAPLAFGAALLALGTQGCSSNDATNPTDNTGAGGSAGGAAGSGASAGSTSTGGSGGASGTSGGGAASGSAGSSGGTGGAAGATSGSGGSGGSAAGSGGGPGGAGGAAGSGGASGGPAGGGGQGGASGSGGMAAAGYVYIESNDPAANAVLAFARAGDGSLTPLPGGSFPTGGKGLSNPTQRLGPSDTDQNFAWAADRKRLFAVNSGSDSIAVFNVNADGSLTAVAGSPFPSGGNNPVSLAIRDSILYVANKEQDGTNKPSYVALAVGTDGALSAPVAGATAQIPIGTSPTQGYLAPGSSLLFGTRFLDANRVPMVSAGQIDAFAIGAGGTLTPAAGSPFALPPDDSGMSPPPPPVALDLIGHPTQKILYVGFPTRAEVGVYTYDTAGVLTFVKAAKNSGMAICWLRTTSDGKRLYTVNSGSSTLSVYDLSDPLSPTETSSIELKGDKSGQPFTDPMGKMQTLTSAPFQFELDPTESHLYVVSQRVTTNAADPSGNQLHALTIAADGSLTEPGIPLELSSLGVPATARPQGVATYLAPVAPG